MPKDAAWGNVGLWVLSSMVTHYIRLYFPKKPQRDLIGAGTKTPSAPRRLTGPAMTEAEGRRASIAPIFKRGRNSDGNFEIRLFVIHNSLCTFNAKMSDG